MGGAGEEFVLFFFLYSIYVCGLMLSCCFHDMVVVVLFCFCEL